MRVVLRKLDVSDRAGLERLVIENIDAIEPGLQVIDRGLLLGHSTIDLVAQDADGSLALIALGLRADDSMLLQMLDGYSWCLEYSQSVRRHYASIQLSEHRPPRVMFVAQRVPEAFQRKLKQISFPSIDVMEFRHLEVNGVPAVYFESITSIRAATSAARIPDVSFADRPVPPRRMNGGGVHRARLDDAATEAAMPSTVQPTHAHFDALIPVTDLMPSAGAPTGPIDGDPAPCERRPLTGPAAAPETRDVVASAEAGAATAEIATATAEVATVTANLGMAGAATGTANLDVTTELTTDAVGVPMEESQVSADATTTDEDSNQKRLFSEAVKVSQLAKDFGIQLPRDGALTRQWIDFLNQLAVK